MAELIFPSDLPCFSLPYTKEPIPRRIETQVESGHVYRRNRYSQQLYRFTLNWRSMRAADEKTLLHFWERETASGILSFTWFDPVSQVNRKVVFESDPKSTVSVRSGLSDVDIVLREVIS